jgi:hypothetical protein
MGGSLLIESLPLPAVEEVELADLQDGITTKRMYTVWKKD